MNHGNSIDDLESTEKKTNTTKFLTNSEYNEVVEVTNSEEVRTPSPRSSSGGLLSRSSLQLKDAVMNDNHNELDENTDHISEDKGILAGGGLKSLQANTLSHNNAALGALGAVGLPVGATGGGGSDQSENSNDEDDDDDDDDDDVQAAPVEGTYDPVDYEHLVVSSEIKELFQYITRYTPQNIELEHKLKPFIPDFIPAVGDIDAFIKVPRPDGKQDSIGLTVLDEPCAKQSDPSVLDLQLRALSKQTSAKPKMVKKVESAEKNVKAIDKWIKDISDLHRAKPPPTVHYSKPMPDIDSLMQEWPPEFEELLKEVGLPTAGLNSDLSSYANIICGILDIPVYKSCIQSLHVLFTLYSAFKNSQHFRNLAEENNMDNSLKETEESDHLVL